MKKTKKLLATILTAVMICATCLPVSAAEPGVPYQTYTDKFTSQNVTASFKHKGAYSYLDDHLQISFTPVQYATGYEILISKDDTLYDCRIYTSDSNFVMLQPDAFLTDCPNGYTVMVRARFGKYIKGLWSKPETVGCNKLHI